TNSYTSFGEDIYGELYIARDGVSGSICRIRDTACAPTAYINSPDTIINCTETPITLNAIYGPGVSYQLNIESVPTGSSSSFTTLFIYNNGSQAYVQVSNASCASASNIIHIFTNATFTGLDSLYCDTSPSITLTGIPSGGTFSGPGITG